MGEFDAFAGDYSDVDALIPGLKPDVEKEAKAERMAKAEKKAVQAQWRKRCGCARRARGIRQVDARQRQEGARARGAEEASRRESDAKPLSGNALAEAEQDKKKAQGEFERWKKENNVAGNGGRRRRGRRVRLRVGGGIRRLRRRRPPSSDSVSGANGGGVPTLVDPEEVAEAEARAAQKKDLELSSREDGGQARALRGVEEGEREAGLRRGRGESRAHLRGRPDHDPRAGGGGGEGGAGGGTDERRVQAVGGDQSATAERRGRGQGGVRVGALFARVRRRRPAGFASARGALEDVVLDDLAIFDAPEGHRLDFMRELEPFLAMRERVRETTTRSPRSWTPFASRRRMCTR